MGLHRRETGVLLCARGVLVSDGKEPLVREEQGFVAASRPVVWQGTAGQPRYKG